VLRVESLFDAQQVAAEVGEEGAQVGVAHDPEKSALALRRQRRPCISP
jgi:hypothetical protein